MSKDITKIRGFVAEILEKMRYENYNRCSFVLGETKVQCNFIPPILKDGVELIVEGKMFDGFFQGYRVYLAVPQKELFDFSN